MAVMGPGPGSVRFTASVAFVTLSYNFSLPHPLRIAPSIVFLAVVPVFRGVFIVVVSVIVPRWRQSSRRWQRARGIRAVVVSVYVFTAGGRRILRPWLVNLAGRPTVESV